MNKLTSEGFRDQWSRAQQMHWKITSVITLQPKRMCPSTVLGHGNCVPRDGCERP